MASIRSDWEEHQTEGTTTPADYARTIVRPPSLSMDGRDWQHVPLYRFQVPSFDVRSCASCLHRVNVRLAGTVLVERTREGRRDRTWSGPGSSAFIPAGVPLSRSYRGQSDFLVMHVVPKLVDEVAADVMELHPDRVRLAESFAEQDARLERFGRLFLAEAEHGGAGTRLFTDTLARALSLHLLRTYSADALRPTLPAAALVGRRLRRAIELMHEGVAEDPSLAELAAASGLSPSQFARAFRAATGESPHRYFTRLRIDLARRLLEETRLPITEVGFRCGFEQPTHFATMFRKVTGLSPRAYRAATGA